MVLTWTSLDLVLVAAGCGWNPAIPTTRHFTITEPLVGQQYRRNKPYAICTNGKRCSSSRGVGMKLFQAWTWDSVGPNHLGSHLFPVQGFFSLADNDGLGCLGLNWLLHQVSVGLRCPCCNESIFYLLFEDWSVGIPMMMANSVREFKGRMPLWPSFRGLVNWLQKWLEHFI